MNPAATISLNAIGQQDTYTTRADPEYSLFKPGEVRQHSNFTKFHRSTQVSNPSELLPDWPFGQSVKVTLNPRNMGDLLSNMYVHIKFPRLIVPAIDPPPPRDLADQLGRHLIESVTMRVDELEVEKYHDDWGIISDELYLDASEKRTKRYTINRNLAEDTSLLQANRFLTQYDSELMIPIPLFFSRKYEGDEYATNNPNRPYFPTCAVHKQKIEFEFVFRPRTFFSNCPDSIKLSEFNVITEEITVAPEERTYLMTKRQIFVTDIVKKHPTVETVVGKDTVKLELVPNIPVKTLNWFLRDTNFEDETVFHGGVDLESNVFANRYNFSSNTVYSVINSFFEPVMQSAQIFIKGQNLPELSVADHTFFKYVVPFNSRLARPMKNIYTYTFSMNPINVEPSGSLDFGELQSNKTVLEIKLTKGLSRPYTLHIYYVGYQTFLFDKGFMSLAY
jgi:hypothetical protein